MLGLLSRLIMLLNFEYVPVKCLITSHMKWKWSNQYICASFIATFSSLALMHKAFFFLHNTGSRRKNVYRSAQINSIQFNNENNILISIKKDIDGLQWPWFRHPESLGKNAWKAVWTLASFWRTITFWFSSFSKAVYLRFYRLIHDPGTWRNAFSSFDLSPTSLWEGKGFLQHIFWVTYPWHHIRHCPTRRSYY